MSRWSFAATAATVGEVPHQVQTSLDVQVERATSDEVTVKQMQAAAKSVVRLVESGLWGRGPFSLALSGNERSFYLSVTSNG